MDIEMNARKLIICCTALLLSANVVWAEEGDEAESTIRLMGAAEAALPEAVTKKITLPPAAAEDLAAVEDAKRVLDNANENRKRREKGLSQADEARERNADMSGEAQDSRENRGRSEDRPEPPVDPGRPGN
jgi:hypothetical protein